MEDRLAGQVIGSPETVRAGVTELVERTGVDELMVVTNTHDGADRLRSYRLLAEALAPRPLRRQRHDRRLISVGGDS